jgi:hypothetical protein
MLIQRSNAAMVAATHEAGEGNTTKIRKGLGSHSVVFGPEFEGYEKLLKNI